MIVGMSWKLCSINPMARKTRKLSMLDVLSEAVVSPEIFISLKEIAGFAPANCHYYRIRLQIVESKNRTCSCKDGHSQLCLPHPISTKKQIYFVENSKTMAFVLLAVFSVEFLVFESIEPGIAPCRTGC